MQTADSGLYSLVNSSRMDKSPGIDIVWFKRDLRLRDHAPLQAAIEAGRGLANRRLLLLYCFEPSVMADPNYDERHWRFVHESLADLNKQLATMAGESIPTPGTSALTIRIFHREVVDVLRALQTQFAIHTIYSHQETGLKVTYDRDKAVTRFCREQGIAWSEFESNGVRRGLKSSAGWQRDWLQTMQAAQHQPDLTHGKPAHLPTDWFAAERGPDLPANWQEANPLFQPGGERNGHRYLTSFLDERIRFYEDSISKPLESRRGCSRLSPYLAWGCLSARQVYQQYSYALQLPAPKAAGQIRGSALFINRLRLQSYFTELFERNERIEFVNKNPDFDRIEKQINTDQLIAWQDGQTGYPLIDACMRCLRQTGYLNFRMRALVTSFLTHHLFQHWQAGGWHLARQFTDFEPGIHYSQLQLQSGILGSDRQPVRIYNPVKQSKEHDPEGVFIKQWIPELAVCPTAYIHEPWMIPLEEQAAIHLHIGIDYPPPIIDIKTTGRHARTQLYQPRQSNKDNAR